MGKQHAKMPKSQRAKQFAPFDAVVGLRKALKEKEKIRVPKKELSDDACEEIDNALKILKINDTATVIWYDNLEQNYFKTEGLIEKIDAKNRIIEINNHSISFDDIYEIF